MKFIAFGGRRVCVDDIVMPRNIREHYRYHYTTQPVTLTSELALAVSLEQHRSLHQKITCLEMPTLLLLECYRQKRHHEQLATRPADGNIELEPFQSV